MQGTTGANGIVGTTGAMVPLNLGGVSYLMGKTTPTNGWNGSFSVSNIVASGNSTLVVGSFVDGNASNDWSPSGSGTIKIGGCSNTCSDDGGATKYPLGFGELNVGSTINVGKHDNGFAGVINCGDINCDGNLNIVKNGQGVNTSFINLGTITPATLSTDNFVNPTLLYVNKTFAPTTTGTYNLGSTSKKWKEVHATTFSGTAITANNVKVSSITTGTRYLVGTQTTSSSSTPLNAYSSVWMNGGLLYASSDERLKDFTDDIKVDFEALKGIPKKYFYWKDKENRGTAKEIGTSAQKLMEIYPEIVTTDDNGNLGVSYERLSIIALAAIDKLYERIKILEEKLNDK